MINVLICSKNRNDELILTLSSFILSTRFIFKSNIYIALDSSELEEKHLIIINYLKNFSNINIVDNKNGNKNSGLGLIIKKVEDGPVLFIDDDALIIDGYKLFDTFSNYFNNGVGLIELMHPINISIKNIDETDFIKYPLFNMENYFRHDFIWDYQDVIDTAHIGGFFLIKDKEVLEGLDFNSLPIFGEDRCIAQFVRSKFLRTVSKPDTGFIHFGVNSNFKHIYDELPSKKNIFLI